MLCYCPQFLWFWPLSFSQLILTGKYFEKFCGLAPTYNSFVLFRLVILETEKGSFLTDNDSMHNFASQVLKVSLNGLSLTVVSFTIVFLFHGVGGGLYCGTVLFR